MRVLILLSVLVLAACEATEAVDTRRTNNPSIPVSLLFDHEGCKVYRFEADGRFRYFANCAGGTTTMSEWTETCGKNCTTNVPDNVSTEYAR